MEKRIGFFEEAPQQKSITRLMFAVIILTSLYIAVYQVMTSGHFDVVAFTTMSGTACGLKLWQKSMEGKPTDSPEQQKLN